LRSGSRSHGGARSRSASRTRGEASDSEGDYTDDEHGVYRKSRANPLDFSDLKNGRAHFEQQAAELNLFKITDVGGLANLGLHISLHQRPCMTAKAPPPPKPKASLTDFTDLDITGAAQTLITNIPVAKSWDQLL
jgi:hypothetical protein